MSFSSFLRFPVCIFLLFFICTTHVYAATAGSANVVTLRVLSSSTPLVPPSIFLNGLNPVNLVVGDSYFEQGVTATDTEGDDLSSDVVITGGPVNTAAVSTTTLLYTVTDPYNMLSASTTRLVIVGPAPVSTSTPPVAPPVNNGPAVSSGGSGSQAHLSVLNLKITTGTSSATIQWNTLVPTVSTLAWGVDADVTAGSISEVIAGTSHSIVINGLQSATTYYLVVHAYTSFGLSNYFLSSFVTEIAPSITPPANVTGLAVADNNGVHLSWVNPTSPAFSGVVITRGTRFFPRDPAEGYIVYEGKSQQVTDINANPASVYYYSVFSKKNDGNFSSGVVVKYVPGTVSPVNINVASSSASSSTSLFGGVVTELPMATLGQMVFIQNKITIMPLANGMIPIQAGHSVLIDISPKLVPRDTEEVLLEINHSYFLFKQLSNGWLQAVIPAAFSYQNPAQFSIHFLAVGFEYRLSGVFSVSSSTANAGTHGFGWLGQMQWYFWFWLLWFLLLLLLILYRVFGHKKST